MKHTKIVCTIGPASATIARLTQMIRAGMNVARINFSHGDHVTNGALIDLVKELRKKLNMPVGIMADLQGPRIRTVVDDDMKIEKGEIITVLDTAQKSKNLNGQKIIQLDWKGIIKDIKKGNHILIEDGLMRMEIIAKKKNFLLAKVIEGGIVKNHKGVNIPDASLTMSAVTKKDEADLKFALEQDVDFIALSFVSNAKEILNVKAKIKKMVAKNARLPQIVAKIERKEAVKNIVEIIHATDSIMVARGDLGIEMDESRVAIYQKEIIVRCLRLAKPVIVATQMLNSMIENPRPTRAEVSDVSNAVIDHTDAVMLSGETANGKYPVEAVTIMHNIINNTEQSPFDLLEHGFLGDKETSISASIAHAAHELSKDMKAKAIVVASVSGFTARMIARHRPENAVYVMTNNDKTHYQLSLVWGVES
ncbi:MAG TPA: pyruvate kinase, partial [Patescibacteria group bacterium]|nr:pyruvate kinase [Patescibacteria group bacterium]